MNSMTDPITRFDPTDHAQILSDGIVGTILYNQVTTRSDPLPFRLAAAAGSVEAANYLWNTMIGPAVRDIQHPELAIGDAIQADLGGQPQDAVVGNAMLAGGAYGGYKAGSKAWQAWQSRSQGAVPAEEEATPLVEEGGGVAEEEGIGDGIGDILLDAGEAAVDAVPEVLAEAEFAPLLALAL